MGVELGEAVSRVKGSRWEAGCGSGEGKMR